LSVSTTARAAHVYGIEVFVVPVSAGVWICVIPFTAILGQVSGIITSVPIACCVGSRGATTAGAAVYFSIEVVIIEPSAVFVVVTLSIPVAVVTTSVSAIIGVRVVASFVFVEGNSSIPIILASAAIFIGSEASPIVGTIASTSWISFIPIAAIFIGIIGIFSVVAISTSACHAIVVGREIIIIPDAALIHAGPVPIAAITTQVSSGCFVIIDEAQSASIAATAAAAHFHGAEVFIVPDTTAFWPGIIPGAVVIGQVSGTVGSVGAAVTTTACAAHVVGAEIIVIPVSAGVWIGIIPSAIVVGHIGGSIVGVSASVSVSRSASAGAAHVAGPEVVIVVVSAGVWEEVIPGAVVIGPVGGTVVSVGALIDLSS
jgi:hypothetical protein